MFRHLACAVFGAAFLVSIEGCIPTYMEDFEEFPVTFSTPQPVTPMPMPPSTTAPDPCAGCEVPPIAQFDLVNCGWIAPGKGTPVATPVVVGDTCELKFSGCKTLYIYSAQGVPCNSDSLNERKVVCINGKFTYSMNNLAISGFNCE